MKPALKTAAVFFCLALLYLLFWPTPVDPAAWTAPTAPELTGPYAVNGYLAETRRIELPASIGPEDVAVDQSGFIYGGLQNGDIVKIDPQTLKSIVFVNTGGRPLGLHFDGEENLIVADAFRGLLKVSPKGQLSVLSTGASGLPFGFTDDVDIAANGLIYFSDASFKFDQLHYKNDALEHRPNGRLMVYDPQTRETRVLLDKLYFANGVALSPDQQFVLVNETWMYRIIRYWITGDRAGQSEIFIENLPGFPDGVSCNGVDTFWIALASPRDPLLDNLAEYPFVRKLVSRLPEFLQPAAVPYSFVLGVNPAGVVTHNLQESSGRPYSMITSVQQHGSRLWLGSLEEKAIGWVAVPEPTR